MIVEGVSALLRQVFNSKNNTVILTRQKLCLAAVWSGRRPVQEVKMKHVYTNTFLFHILVSQALHSLI